MNKRAAGLAIVVINFYKNYLSPLKGRTCRFYPSCSQYAIDAINKHGLLKGFWLSGKRIIKCHPFQPGGYDVLK